MYKRDFDLLLGSKNIPRTLFLYGACDYQLSFLESEILNLWGGSEVLKFYFDEYDFKSAKAYLSQASLFGDKNIMLLKLEKAPPQKELEELVKLCEKSDMNYLLFIFYGEDAKAKELAKAFGKSFVRVFKPNQNDAIKFLINEAKKINLNISGFVLQNLYSVQNENLSLAVSELPKLSLLNKEISIADVDNIVFGMGSVELETLIIKLLNGEKIMGLYKTISQSGTINEVGLINATQSHLFQLFLFHAYIKINGSFDAEKILGHPLPPQIAKQRSEMAMRLKPKIFTKLFKTLTNAEFSLKTNSNLDKESYMLSTLLKMQSLLKSA
ncbi:MAG: DNA polymerase III subunit delta [Campylobacteraceae bacterium]|jgi:DNA polymerase-3 subunit delta|nr:DNA polymerase III subunit delta [Campylobacteraceae bacterium]